MRDWPPCPPIQRGGGRRSRPGVTPFISALTVARCPATFPGVWPQLRDTLSTSRSVGRGTGAFIYALSADETSPALAAPRHAITALFSCCFKCPCPLRRQPHFRSNADRAYNTLHFASKVVCQRDTLWKPRTTKQAEYPALFRCLILSLFCCQQPPFRGLFSPFVKFGVLDVEDTKSRFFLRLQVENRAGALANIAGVLGNNDVSIAQMVQKRSHDGIAEIVVITDLVKERHFNDAIRIMEGMSVVREISGIIRVY